MGVGQVRVRVDAAKIFQGLPIPAGIASSRYLPIINLTQYLRGQLKLGRYFSQG